MQLVDYLHVNADKQWQSYNTVKSNDHTQFQIVGDDLSDSPFRNSEMILMFYIIHLGWSIVNI